jgi:hypothetical protein
MKTRQLHREAELLAQVYREGNRLPRRSTISKKIAPKMRGYRSGRTLPHRRDRIESRIPSST